MSTETLGELFRWVALIPILITIVLAYRIVKSPSQRRGVAILGLIVAILILISHVGIWIIDSKYAEQIVLEPYQSYINLAESDVCLLIRSNEEIDEAVYHYRCSCVLVDDSDTLLYMMATQFLALPINNDTTEISFTARLSGSQYSLADDVRSLNKAECLEIYVPLLPDSLEIYSGEACILINGNIRIIIPIEFQRISNGIIRNSKIFSYFFDFPPRI